MLLQANATGNIYIYSILNNKFGTVASTIPKDQIYKFFYVYSKYYLLQSKGLTEVLCSNKADLTLKAIRVTLPYQTYSITFGTIFDIFFIPMRPYIYKSGLCLGQSLANSDETACPGYLSSVQNCSYTPIIP